MRRWLAILLTITLIGMGGCGRGNSPFKLLFVPKLKGIPYFQACKKGAEEAAKELKIELVYDGPTTADINAQIDLLSNAIYSGEYQGILVACNNPDQIAPTLKKARDNGLLVVTYDADADPKSGRQFFVNQATYEAVAHKMVDVMADELEPKGTGKVAILTSYINAPNQHEWFVRMKKYAAEKYPKMTLLDETEHGEDRGKGIDQAKALINAHQDLKGIIGLTSVAVPAAAEAVRQSGKKGQIKVTGVSTPADMKDYVQDGTVTTFVLWNPVDLGYLTVQVAYLLHQGKMPANGTGTIKAGRLGDIQVNNYEVLLGQPMIFNKENIGKYDF
jgi:ABC-type sugar transport system substrate-binding protein